MAQQARHSFEDRDGRTSDRSLAGAAALCALIPRLVYLYSVRPHAFFNTALVDAGLYDQWANQILSGDWLSRSLGPTYLSPGYAYALAAIHFIFGSGFMPVFILQSIAGSISCGLVFLICLRSFESRSSAGIAAFISAFYAFSIFIEGTLTTASWIGLFNLSALFLILKSVQKGSLSSSFFAGLSLAASSLFRPNILLAVPLFAAYLWFKSPSPRWRTAVFFLAGLGLLLAPVIVRNGLVVKKFSVVPAASGGMVLYIGNVPEGKALDPDRPEIQGEFFRAEASRRAGRELSSDESSQFWLAQTVMFIRSSPAQWLGMMMNKASSFLNWYEIPSNYHFYFYKEIFPFFKFPFLAYGVVVPLGLLGFVLSIRNFGLGPVHILFLVYVLNALAFLVTAEYRYAAVPPLIIFAGHGLNEIYRAFQSRKFKTVLLYGLLLIPFYVLAYLNMGYHPAFGREYLKLGAAEGNRGNLESAADSFQKAIDHGGEGAAHFNLAEIRLRQNRPDLALGEFESAVRNFKNPADMLLGHLRLGQIYGSLNNLPAAEQQFKSALALEPNSLHAHQNLGNIYYMQKKTSLCRKEWEAALRLNPSDSALKANLQSLR